MITRSASTRNEQPLNSVPWRDGKTVNADLEVIYVSNAFRFSVTERKTNFEGRLSGLWDKGPVLNISLSNLATYRGRSLSCVIFLTCGPQAYISRTSYGEKFRYLEADGRAPDRDHRSVVVGCQRRVLRRI